MGIRPILKIKLFLMMIDSRNFCGKFAGKTFNEVVIELEN